MPLRKEAEALEYGAVTQPISIFNDFIIVSIGNVPSRL